ncbi:MAG: hypothetical protein IKV50_04945 [Clostridia bacterium]|nr:hypothetical protein [Clostridia bacterium]MBR6553386.1 hypothetical protein [Clostridia bacterium]
MRKKLTQLLVCFFVLAAALGTVYASAASDSVLGDVNGDGNVNVLDYALLKRYVMGIGELPEDGQAVADVNKDGKINAIDYARVKGHVLGAFDIHLDQHLFLQYKDKGNCEALSGEVSILLVFVSDSESSWDPVSRETAESELCREMIRMMDYAEGYGAPLSILYGEWDISVAVDMESNNSEHWEAPVCAAMGFQSLYDLQMALERDWGVASAPVVFVLNKPGRAAAYSSYSEGAEEYLTVYSSEYSTFCHELLHLYGARDYYYPMAVSDAAATFLPDSIMLSGDTVDELTAYTVGWTKSLGRQAIGFLRATSHLTQKDLDEAAQAEQLTGYGTKYYADGGVYIGYMEFGTPVGQGEYYSASGNAYKGEFQNGTFHGYGVYTYADGAVYEGFFENGTFHGAGMMTWAGGDRYQGDYQNGSRTGQGVYWWAKGDRYEGGFLNGKLHGYGTYYYASGNVKRGYWEQGVFKG